MSGLLPSSNRLEPERSSVASAVSRVDTSTMLPAPRTNFGFYEYRGHAMLDHLQPLPSAAAQPSPNEIELELAPSQTNYFADAERTDTDEPEPPPNPNQYRQSTSHDSRNQSLPLSIDGLHDHVKHLQDKIECLQKENEQFQLAAGAREDADTIHRVSHRLAWLVSLLILQSFSSLILERFSDLIASHQSIMFFITMILGAGGNAAGQSVVLAVRSIALNQPNPVRHEVKVGFILAAACAATAFVRTIMQLVGFVDALAISVSMGVAVFTAVCIGTMLPRLFVRAGIDPAHSAAATMVCCDITGISITCVISLLIISLLGSPE